ncbi:MAG TPA: thioredoxin domain-containing protein [Bryobacteraceae bacterium]|nr:thioredoxin domain-containing protein [Bryobacteraceae bacterium]
MHRTLVLAALAVYSLFAQQPASNWKTATSFPGVDMKNLTPAQQKTVIAVLREETCPCGCPMQLAQCRIEDPACSQSLTLAAIVAEAAAAGKTPAQIRKILADSPLVKAASQRDRILLDPVNINILGAPVKGPAAARVTLVEFSDFQCPFCVRAIPNLEAVMKSYPNDVRLVYKQFPLETHSQAALAARASMAAHAQGKFWPLHDKMYANSRAINRTTILTWARELGLDVPKFTKTLDAPETQSAVDRDMADGSRAGVNATPTIFINGKKYQGPLEPAQLLPIIAEELKGR